MPEVIKIILIILALAFVFFMTWALCGIASKWDRIEESQWEEYERKDDGANG